MHLFRNRHLKHLYITLLLLFLCNFAQISLVLAPVSEISNHRYKIINLIQQQKQQPEIDHLSKLPPEDVLEIFQYNWDYFINYTAYLIDNPGQDPRNEQTQNLNILNRLIEFRKQKVLDLIIDSLHSYYKIPKETEITYTLKPLNSKEEFIFNLTLPDKTKRQVVFTNHGSKTSTSDFDLTIDVSEHFLESCKILEEFNKNFRKKYVLDSGYVFDTNLYTKGFMLKMLSEYNLKNFPEHEERRRKTRLAFSFLAIREVLTPTEWDKYKTSIFTLIKSKAYTITADADLKEIFNLTETFYNEIQEEIEKSPIDADVLSTNNKEAIQIYVKNILFEKYQIQCGNLVEKFDKLQLEIQNLSPKKTEEKEQLEKAIAEIVLDWEFLQAKALFFANEAYYTPGAMELYLNPDKDYTIEKYIESALMNLGYALQHITEEEKLTEKLQAFQRSEKMATVKRFKEAMTIPIPEEEESDDNAIHRTTPLIIPPSRRQSIQSQKSDSSELLRQSFASSKTSQLLLRNGKEILSSSKYIHRLDTTISTLKTEKNIHLILPHNTALITLFNTYKSIFSDKSSASNSPSTTPHYKARRASLAITGIDSPDFSSNKSDTPGSPLTPSDQVRKTSFAIINKPILSTKDLLLELSATLINEIYQHKYDIDEQASKVQQTSEISA
jgi:hypothetical protein